jgi:perosamine synthetase
MVQPLQLALRALGIGPGDEVIVPALSYIATANVVELAGARPIFVDTQPRTFNIDPELISAAITPRTRAIIPVHEFGLCCDIRAVVDIARKHQLSVIEDAACALGASDEGQHAGTFGDVGSFSLHPRKAISCGEGGVLVTAAPQLESRLRILRNHGIEMKNGAMEFVEAGFNCRLTDFQAALVRSQLARLPAALERKQELAQIYFNEIKHSGVELPVVPLGKRHSWQTFHIQLEPSLHQADVLAFLRSKGIGCNYGAQCMPAQDFFSRTYQLDAFRLFPNAHRAWTHGIALPLYEKLTARDIEFIAQTVNQLSSA